MFVGQCTLRLLNNEALLNSSMFRTRTDLQLEFMDGVKKELLRGVPPSHCAVLLDNWPALVWLVQTGYVVNVREVCSQGRTLLHVSVEEESVETLRRLLQVWVD